MQTLWQTKAANCEVTIKNLLVNGSNVTIQATIRCKKQLSGFDVFYEKTVSFNKEVWVAVVGTDCLVDVRDNDSGKCEVDKIAVGGC